MVTIPISILMIITIVYLIIAIVASCLLAASKQIKETVTFLFSLPIVLFLGNFILYIIAGILDPKLDMGKTIKEGLQGIGYMCIFALLIDISFLIVSVVAKVFFAIFGKLFRTIGNSIDTGVLSGGDIAETAIIKAMKTLGNINSAPGYRLPIWLWPIQFIVYLPLYLLGLVLLLILCIGRWCKDNYPMVGLFFFIILDILIYRETNGEDHAFIFLNFFFNKQKWAAYMASAGTVGAPIGCSSLTYMFFTIYWTLIAYITPVAIVTYLLFITFDNLNMSTNLNNLKNDITGILKSVNNQSATLFATNKGKLVLNYAIVLLFYGAVYYVCNYFLYFI